jgi:beta-phosphoglucomutase-like phosphatase (HAD superfamily)
VYLLAARRLGVPPSACVALEDSEFGVRAAAAAGMRVIQVPDLVPSSELSRSLAQVVGSLEQARPLLQSLLGIALPARAGTPTCDLA